MPTPAPFDPAANGWRRLDSPSGFQHTIGPVWIRDTVTGLQYGIAMDERHTNRRGNGHGGFIATILDTAMGFTAGTGIEGGVVTINLNVQFIAATQPGDFLVADAVIQKRTRSIVFMQGSLSAGDRLVASATGTWKIIPGLAT